MKWCTTKGADYSCPHCGAQYETEYRHYTTKERDAADCVICGKEMNWWNWPAPGSEDTELGVLMELEVRHGEAEVYA